MILEKELYTLGMLDAMAFRVSPIHRLDPRAKTVTTLVFVFVLMSFHKYALVEILPFAALPIFWMLLADIPIKLIFKKILIVSPFAFFVAIFNPIFDRQPALQLGGLVITSGWISFASIMLKFFLSISMGLLLIATTSFSGVCFALQSFKIPNVFVIQLMFLYRYLFVIAHEAMRMIRARQARAFDESLTIKDFTSIISVLFVRSFERAQRLYSAMMSRGYTYTIKPVYCYKFTPTDTLFVIICVCLMVICRLFNIPLMFDNLIRTVG